MNRSDRGILLGLLLLMGGAVYLICSCNPLRWDDLMYEYMWYDYRPVGLLHPINLENRIDNITEAFVSQCNHYVVMNGRFIVHFITQCFCGFVGKDVFNVCNAIVYVFFLFMGVRFVDAKINHQVFFVLTGLWFLPPIQWIFSFDVVFPINYLWTTTACLFFLFLFHNASIHTNQSLWLNLLFLLYGVFCGNFHEGFTLLISGSLFFYVLFHFRELNNSQWCLIVGMWIGTLTVLLSPGIWGRATGVSAVSFEELLSRKLDILIYSKRFYLFLLLLGVSYWVLGKRRMKSFLRNNQLECMIVFLGFIFLFMLPYYSQRMGFPMEIFSVLLTLKLCLLLPVKKLFTRFTSLCLSFILLAHVTMTVYYAKEVGNEYNSMLNEYKKSSEGLAFKQSFKVPKLWRSYVLRLGDESSEVGLISFTNRKEMMIKTSNKE